MLTVGQSGKERKMDTDHVDKSIMGNKKLETKGRFREDMCVCERGREN